jgi:hypothetical protein
MELDAAGVRKEHEVPLAAYIAGAEMIRQQLCNATDLYPTLSPPAEGESVEPLPLEYPDSVDPNGAEPLPLPVSLKNPAADVEPTVHLALGVKSDGGVVPAYADLPVPQSGVEVVPLVLPTVSE